MRAAVSASLSPRQRGDFQTPIALARQVWSRCTQQEFDLIIEPTFGQGAFLAAMPGDLQTRVAGWEIDRTHYEAARAALAGDARFDFSRDLMTGDVFDSTANELRVQPTDSVLVIGNPPWVTNAEQGFLGGSNTGRKTNVKGLAGLEALTGSANFDISEAIVLHFVRMLRTRCARVRFALLVKFSVARKLLQWLAKDELIGEWEFHHIDAMQHFGAAVEAGLLLFSVSHDLTARRTCRIYREPSQSQTSEIGFSSSHLIYDMRAYEETAWLESHGASHYIWRQGVKHDASSVMELEVTPNGLQNKLGEAVEVEPEALFRFFKSSDLHNGRDARYLIPIYQNSLSDSLEDLPSRFPKLYAYLQAHATHFTARKSSIYRNRPAFSLFGIGDYTTSPYKIAIGGLYKMPRFRLLVPTPRRAVVDDTSYLIATNNLEEAVFVLALLELPDTKKFLLAISCEQDKRRWSKSILARLMLPSMSQCPSGLQTEIFTSWTQHGTFSTSIFNQLRAWIQTQKLF